MTQVASNAFRVEVIAGGGPFTPPYSLPGAGQTLAIGTNTAYSITPPNMSQGNWSYSLFNNFGGGCFVASYSQGGAFVWAGTGGHGVPANVGAGIFDFQDATWKRRDPPASQGGTTFYSNADYSVGDTTGANHYEINGSNGIPTPAHTYGSLSEIPTAFGGGPKGSVINTQRGALTAQSVGNANTTQHKINLDTGLWTRASSLSGLYGAAGALGFCALDVPRSRIWILNAAMNIEDNVAYYDLTDGQSKQTPTTNIINDAAQGACWMHAGYLFRQGLNGKLFAFNPATNLWSQMTLSGSVPQQEAFAYYPTTGNFYYVDDNAGSTLTRLIPPSNPAQLLTGTWTVNTVTVSPALPARTSDGGSGPVHYNNFFYVPSIQRLAWVPGGGAQVYLVNPAT